jgi:predicted porin
MKKISTIFALLAVIGTAQAQSSVTIYGTLDAGFLYQNKSGGHAGTGVTSDPSYLLISGGNSSNKLGFRGIEDLGGGNKAGFELETQFNIGTGSVSGALFNHYSNLFLENDAGRITAGLQRDPAYYAMGKADPRDLKQAFSAAGWWNFLEGRSTSSAVTVYEANALSYSIKKNDIYVGILYSFGEVAGNTSAGQTLSTGVVYDNGTAILSSGYVQKNNSSGLRDLRVWTVGGGYRLAQVTVRGGYTRYWLPLGNAVTQITTTSSPVDIRVADIGANWAVAPRTTLSAAYYFAQNNLDKKNATSSYVIDAAYQLSKQTKLYAFLGLMHAKSGANGLTNLMTSSLTSGAAGQNTTASGIGITHNF